ncbi:MAG: hypothetical protein L0H12_05625, partial [Nitrosospira sp.]|nr:hypothetical protein [Nitrosospira sp.]
PHLRSLPQGTHQTEGMPPAPLETDAYLNFIEELLREGVPLRGVLLYGLARPSMQPEAPRLTKIDRDWMEIFCAKIQALGLAVKLTP